MTTHRSLEQIKRDIEEEVRETGSSLVEERELAAAAGASPESAGEQANGAARRLAGELELACVLEGGYFRFSPRTTITS